MIHCGMYKLIINNNEFVNSLELHTDFVTLLTMLKQLKAQLLASANNMLAYNSQWSPPAINSWSLSHDFLCVAVVAEFDRNMITSYLTSFLKLRQWL